MNAATLEQSLRFRRNTVVREHHHDYAPKYAVHEHPIRWDLERQVWVCGHGCGFERKKRPGEECPGPDYGRGYQPIIGPADRVVNYTRSEDY